MRHHYTSAAASLRGPLPAVLAGLARPPARPHAHPTHSPPATNDTALPLGYAETAAKANSAALGEDG